MVMTNSKAGLPAEKTITLSSPIAPRLARRGGVDEAFAWESREFLRKLCIGQEVTFSVDYSAPSIGREFGSVFLRDENVAVLVVSEGWAKWSVLLPVVLTLIAIQNDNGKIVEFISDLCFTKWALEAFARLSNVRAVIVKAEVR